MRFIFVALASLSSGARALCSVDTTSVELVKQQGYDLTGQTHVITGGDSGLGLSIATGLAQANARVVFLAHDESKTRAVALNITSETGNDKLAVIATNQLSLESVKGAADTLLAQEDQINGFFAIAGSAGFKTFVTEDGFEGAFEVGYLSHYYLLQRLLPKLRKTQGRVIMGGSTGMDPLAGLCQGMQLPNDCGNPQVLASIVTKKLPQNFISVGNALSIYMRIMLAHHVAITEAGSGVTAFSFHPGMVATNDVKVLETVMSADAVNQMCSQTPWYMCLYRNQDGSPAKTFPLPAAAGGVSGIYLAAAPLSELADINGAQTCSCGYKPSKDVTFDPYDDLVQKKGQAEAQKYLKEYVAVSEQLLSSVGYGTELQSFSPHNEALPLLAVLGSALLCGVALRLRSARRQGTVLQGAKTSLLAQA